MLLASAPALAHKLNLFAAADGRRIEGEVYFAGGGKAADVPVLVQSTAGKTLAELRSGADGSFAYDAEAPMAYLIVAETPDGHRAQWRIGAAELAGAFAPTGDAGAAGSSLAGEAAEAGDTGESSIDPPPARQTGTNASEGALDPAMAAAIERAVARQVRPLREEALAAREAVQFRDVLGGIGYILGLAGLGLWWRCRRAQTDR